MNSRWKKILAVALTLVMVLSALPGVAFATDDDDSQSEVLDVTWEKVENNSFLTDQADTRKQEDAVDPQAQYSDKDVVRVSIILSGKSTIDAGYKTKEIVSSASAQAYREKLKADQKTVEQRISTQALGGRPLDVVWNLTLAANLISANVEYGKIEAIKNVIGVKDVVIETRYEPAVVSRDALEPEMSIASGMTGGQMAWDSGYTGAGQAVAIIDTGLDTDHQSFDTGAYEHALEELGAEPAITEDFVASVLNRLNVYDRYQEKYGTELTAADVYLNTKVPFAYNYIDNNLDVTHDNDTQGEHGSHVSGISAANRYIPDGAGGYSDALETVLTQGEAPDAQILAMKVFGKAGGAYDSDYMAAIEDSIILKAASTNLSLGSSAAGFVSAEDYQDFMDSVTDTDLVLVMSAGNSYYWADQTQLGYTYSDDTNFDTVGSPGSYTNSLSVASVDNNGMTSAYILADGEYITYTESSGYGNALLTTIAGDYEYVYVDSLGADIDESTGEFTRNDFDGLDLTGKIGITNRGTSSFFVKANAAAGAGAAGVVIANNQPGTIGMNLSGYEYSVPVVSITQADGQYLKAIATSTDTITVDDETEITVYFGSLTVGDKAEVFENEGTDYVMSDFSSWGVPGDISLKPEITAPGGNIYSVNGASAETDLYENMSGTSMAAPQVAGLAAVMAQYIKETGLYNSTGLTPRQLINSLFMSTAKPLTDSEAGGEYYSVMKQGAGLVQLDKAMSARTYILMDDASTASAADGKVKAELGETGSAFDVGFTIYNLTDEDIALDLSGDFFTQDRFDYYTYDAEGSVITDESGDVISEYLDTWSKGLSSSITWYVDGAEYSNTTVDINGDGVLDEADVSDLLAYVVGNVDDTTGWDLDTADYDGDGDIDTYDVYLILEACGEAAVTAPAGGSVTIKAAVVIDDLVDNSYVEGYIFAAEADTDEGVEGVEHSIPVLGFYGDWSASSMFDIGSHLEYLYGEEKIDPYMGVYFGTDARDIETFMSEIDGDLFYFGGNPILTDTDADGNNLYLPERNAINGASAMYGVRYSQLRNAGAARFLVTDAEGNELYTAYDGPSYSAFYYYNGSTWQNTSTVYRADYRASLVAEGTQLTYSYTLAPEYYVTGDPEDVNWDALSANDTVSISATVDNTAPELKNVVALRDAEVDDEGNVTYTYELSLDVLDNQYIAAVAIMDQANYTAMVKGGEADYLGIAGADTDAGSGETYSVDFSYTSDDSETPEQILVEVYDYALNETTYKLNMKKKAQLADEENYSIEFVKDDVTIIGNGTKQLSWLVNPWGVEDLPGYSISFVSSDETIATVDADGLVTSVSDVDADCTVTATMSYEGITASAECTVHIRYVDKDLNAVVWDENGSVYFSRFNLKSLPEYEKLSYATERPASVAVDPWTGNAYAATFDTEEWLSTLYAVDIAAGEDGSETYTLTEIGDSSIGYVDLAPAPGLSLTAEHEYILAVYEYYVVVVDAETGDYAGAISFANATGGNNLVGITYETSQDLSEYGYGISDWIYVVDEAGGLYETGLVCVNGAFGRAFDIYSDGSLGYATDTPYFNSLYCYYDEAESEEEEDIFNLVWSCFNEDQSVVDMIYVSDFYGNADVYNVGSFDEDVWPVGGLFESAAAGTDAGNRSASKSGYAVFGSDELVMAETEVEITAHEGSSVSKGGLNAVSTGSAENSPIAVDRGRGLPDGIQPPANGTNGVAYEADGYTYIIDYADAPTNNGLIKITFNPDEVNLGDLYDFPYLDAVDFEEFGEYYDEETGEYTLTIGFVNRTPLVAEEYLVYVIASLNDETCNSVMTIATQINNDDIETETVPFESHSWSGPVWEWADDYSAATATFTCEKCGEVITVDAEITYSDLVYTATAVDPDGNEVVDTVEIDMPAPEITTQPESLTVAAGTAVGLTVAAEYGESYQWQYSLDGETWKNCKMEGADTDTFSFTASMLIDGRQYRCVVSNESGSTESYAATITVVGIKTLASVTVAAKDTVTLKAVTTGAVSYQWQYSLDGETWKNCKSVGYDTDTFSFTAGTSLNGRQYRCVIKNGGFTVNSNASTLTVVGITSQPASLTVTAKSTVTLKVAATGAASYQWQYSDDGTTWKNCTMAGAKTDTFSFTASALLNGRQYRCVVKNGRVTVNSNAATLTVKSGPEITTQPASVTAAAKSKVTFTIVAPGAESYQWQYSDDGTTWKNCTMTGYNTDTFSFTASASLNGRQYRCIVSDASGSTTSAAATLTVK